MMEKENSFSINTKETKTTKNSKDSRASYCHTRSANHAQVYNMAAVSLFWNTDMAAVTGMACLREVTLNYQFVSKAGF